MQNTTQFFMKVLRGLVLIVCFYQIGCAAEMELGGFRLPPPRLLQKIRDKTICADQNKLPYGGVGSNLMRELCLYMDRVPVNTAAQSNQLFFYMERCGCPRSTRRPILY